MYRLVLATLRIKRVYVLVVIISGVVFWYTLIDIGTSDLIDYYTGCRVFGVIGDVVVMKNYDMIISFPSHHYRRIIPPICYCCQHPVPSDRQTGKHILSKIKAASNPMARVSYSGYNMDDTERNKLVKQIQKVFQDSVTNFETQQCLTRDEEDMGVSKYDNCYQILSLDLTTKLAPYVVTVGEPAYYGVNHDVKTHTKMIEMILGELYLNAIELIP
ncbi:unnamed protein product [Oppiella nova]|uniref:Uncharacterized protein n=1 Tax=Oppiella nova TaxID=334625 RepID=A0A7R9LZK3_9ACAR|nr:unnamed protein product [Oppiella nova]CAG2167836.1 unnamed protein product [Oppiella nova]